MATYGPWTQDPDYETFSTKIRTDPEFLDDRGHDEQEVVRQGEYYKVTPGDLGDALAGAWDVHGSTQTVAVNHGVTLSFGYRLSHPDLYSNWGAYIARNKWRVEPPIDGFLYSPIDDGIVDPNALGVEYQEGTFDPANPWGPAQASIKQMFLRESSEIWGAAHDSTNAAGNYALMDGYTTAVILDSAGSIAEIPGPPSGDVGPQPLGRRVDLTPYLQGSWTGVVWTETRTPIAPANMEDVGPFAFGSTEYGWIFQTMALHFVLQPPVYRFVYPDERVITGSVPGLVRRQFT